MTDKAPATEAARLRALHRDCIACRPRERGGVGLQFTEHADGGVEGTFPCDQTYQGYPGWVHGGMVAMLFDEAMTYALIARGMRGITARLNIRYRHPLDLGSPAVVRAWVTREEGALCEVESEITQSGRTRAVASAKFYGQGADELPDD